MLSYWEYIYINECLIFLLFNVPFYNYEMLKMLSQFYRRSQGDLAELELKHRCARSQSTFNYSCHHSVAWQSLGLQQLPFGERIFSS